MEVMRYELTAKKAYPASGVEVITSLIAIMAILKQLAASSGQFQKWLCQRWLVLRLMKVISKKFMIQSINMSQADQVQISV
jgi:hypothetical protein